MKLEEAIVYLLASAGYGIDFIFLNFTKFNTEIK